MYSDVPASAPATTGSSKWRNLFFATPVRGLISICGLQLLLWTLVPWIISRTPPTDTLEGYMWGREWVPMTYKHPQMPAWLLEIAHDLTGSFTWAHLLLSQIVVCATFVLVFLLARDMVGKRGALASVLLLPTLAVFSWGTPQFNHDVMQMPFWVAVCWLFWRAERDNRIGWWIALGLVSGVSLYAKFSMGLIMLFGGLWLVAEPQARKRLASPGPWIALAIVAVFSAMILYNLEQLHFLPLTYADGRDGWVMRHRSRLYYIGVQLGVLLFFPLALYASGLWRRTKEIVQPTPGPLLRDPRARMYLLWMGAVPPLLLALVSPFTGVGENWSKPMYSLVGLIAVAYLGQRLSDRVMRNLVCWAVGMVLLGATVYGVSKPASCYFKGKMNNSCLPGPTIGARLQDLWHTKEHRPLGIVAGEDNLMMATGVFASDMPSMFTEFNFAEAPWITPARIARQGMLVVWSGNGRAPAPSDQWTKGLPVGHERFAWTPGHPPMTVSYVMVPPTVGASQAAK
ncbi:glycosyltransferase family 39 protein [Jiella sp. M17.18]|uniref:glycosyltransferase family 39 protein n=1 Tax=Jiella sp. M17.18 TaxID=3234247 RepID=UPI0034DF1185